MQATGDGHFQQAYLSNQLKVLEVPKQFTSNPIVHNKED